MSPRVLFVDHVGVLGGGELSLLSIAQHFRESSRVVLFEDGPFRERLQEAGIEVEVLPAPHAVTHVQREGSLWHDFRALPGVAKLAWTLARHARPFDLLYANSQKSMIVAALAGLLARRPVIWHLRDLMTPDHFSPLHRRGTAMIANRLVRRVIANARATREAFIASGGQPGRVRTVHNGISTSRFEDVPTDLVRRLREDLGLPEGAPVVGVFSRLAPWKGQHVLLQALTKLPDAQALFVGNALFEADAAYARELHRQASKLGLDARVHFLGFRSDIPALMHLVDVVVHTSVAPEPFGRVIVEGMLAGRPVIATRAGGAIEIVEDGATGLLVPPGASDPLADALQMLLARPALAARLAQAGRVSARERFSVARMLEGVEQQIEDLQMQE